MIYIELFWSFFTIGLFGFGGGYSILSLIQHEVVDIQGWLTIADFTNIVAISQVTPGPIAINCATYVGYTATNSILGSAVATVAVSLPSLFIMILISRFIVTFRTNVYVSAALSTLKPAIIGLIASAALLLSNPANFIDYMSFIIFALVFIAAYLRVNPIILVFLSGLAGYIWY
jgi:chromate transporter